MANFYRAYKVNNANIPAYFIETTATPNVDDRPMGSSPVPAGTAPIEPNEAIEEIGEHLYKAASSGQEPSLVISVHGFNSPRKSVLDSYAQAFNSVNGDPAILTNKGVVCLGYRWPSERIGCPVLSGYTAAPWVLVALVLFGLLSFWQGYYSAGWFFLAIPIAGMLLRAIVYFRDSYRATNYGVPDLVEIIRFLDKKLADKKVKGVKQGATANPIGLSFIGHSMGAYVVTNTIRVLSDVFDKNSIGDVFDESATSHEPGPEIGNVFSLKRLILVSPDIPAEALISSRANFLSSSLRRVDEAFLFSNEGDEVLRQISVTANYFSFPTRKRRYGYRFGNVGILADRYGVVNLGDAWSMNTLRIGYKNLQQLYSELGKSVQFQDQRLVKKFKYFDCTDYIEGTRGLLTFAKPNKQPSSLSDLAGNFSWARRSDR